MQGSLLVLGQHSASADAGPGCITSGDNFSEHLLSIDCHAHDAGDWYHHLGTLLAI